MTTATAATAAPPRLYAVARTPQFRPSTTFSGVDACDVVVLEHLNILLEHAAGTHPLRIRHSTSSDGYQLQAFGFTSLSLYPAVFNIWMGAYSRVRNVTFDARSDLPANATLPAMRGAITFDVRKERTPLAALLHPTTAEATAVVVPPRRPLAWPPGPAAGEREPATAAVVAAAGAIAGATISVDTHAAHDVVRVAGFAHAEWNELMRVWMAGNAAQADAVYDMEMRFGTTEENGGIFIYVRHAAETRKRARPDAA